MKKIDIYGIIHIHNRGIMDDWGWLNAENMDGLLK